MPELPEVETTRTGIAPHLNGRRVTALRVRQPQLRWPVPADLGRWVRQREISAVSRRAKYLLLTLPPGQVLIHLGMSGSLRLVPAGSAAGPHDHVDLELDSGRALRLTDPRRFGAVLWQPAGTVHPLLARLGPEPLGPDFHGDYLYAASRGRSAPVKAFIMDQRVVVGVGNIYASEALFLAGIRPDRAAGRVGPDRYRALAGEIATVLRQAIAQGGTTLRDFVGGDGRPGYFRQALRVYGRGGLPCPRCGGALRSVRVGQRGTVYCPGCQR